MNRSAAAVLGLLLLIGSLAPRPVSAGEDGDHLARPRIDRLLAAGGFVLARDDTIVSSRNPDQLLVPASIWKIATALASLAILGPDYRFSTVFLQDAQDNLYIQGHGDPFLVSEEIETITARLAGKVKRINDIFLDDSAYRLAGAADGTGSSLNPYDAVNGALVSNFNTVHLAVAADGAIRPAEPQTPALPLMKTLGSGLKPGTHRINIGARPERILQHTGELFRAFQQKYQIPGQGAISRAPVPPGLTPLYVHRSSRPLNEVIRGLLLYSNNFTANQLFLACGSRRYGPPATWEKGQRALQNFLQQELELTSEEIRVREGSGLSRENRLTPRAMLKILNRFKPYSDLLPMDKGRLVKSGTLTGVYSYAGFFRKPTGLDGFVLILNQPQNHRDLLLEILAEVHRSQALPATARAEQ